MDHPRSLTIPRRAVPFLLVAAAAVVAGGLAAAVTGPTGWDDGSWVAAYLVLVVGVGQAVVGAGRQVLLGGPPEADARLAAQVVLFNLACALVLVGTLVESPATVTAGGVSLVAALAALATAPRGIDRPRVARLLYGAVLAVLLVSTPIGVALSWARA